jgi:hypothetical protein
MDPLEWCESFVHLNGSRISFADRPYLRAVYNSRARRVVMRCSRQVEKTTLICNVVCRAAVVYPGVHIVIVFPRHDQASVFAKSRLRPVIAKSPILRRILLGQSERKIQVNHMQFRNSSEVFIRSAYHSADAVRGIDADFLLIDEFQDIAAGDLPVLEESLSHSWHRRVFLTGTPKTVDNHLEDAFNRSTANEWRVACRCGALVRLDEKCLGLHGPICPQCHEALELHQARWVPLNPDSLWGDGFTVNHLATPWLDYHHLLERQRIYNPALFQNECLGLPTQLGDHLVTREQCERCCTLRTMAQSREDVSPDGRERLFAGIDWGGGAESGTVLVIGFMQGDDVQVVRMDRFRAQEDPEVVLQLIAQRCHDFRVKLIAADGMGNGQVYNNLLLARLPSLAGLYAIQYSVSDQEPRQYRGRLWRWTVGRTPSLGMVFTRIKTQRVHFPRIEDSSSFLAEIYCETAAYDEHERSITFTRPATQPDDALHALNYAAILGRRNFDVERAYGNPNSEAEDYADVQADRDSDLDGFWNP